MLEAQEAGRAGSEARRARARRERSLPRADRGGGLGGGFRHRMGHGIGLDVHERPFLSPEDETPLELGMTFTDEPSVIVDGSFGVRVEDVIEVTATGGNVL